MVKRKRKSRSEHIARKRRGRFRKRLKRNEQMRRVGEFDQVVLDYYQFTFLKLHDELDRFGEKFVPAPTRATFWKTKERGEYSPEAALSVLQQYLDVLEQELANQLSNHSLAYWLHIYRRLAPRSFNLEHGPEVAHEVRAILEAGVQKYSMLHRCSGVGMTNEVEPKEILNGMLFDTSIPKFYRERLSQNLDRRQLVLLKFGLDELRQFYRIEALAYEMSSTIAKKRLAGRGAPLIVKSIPPYFMNKVTDEIVKLVNCYVQREWIFDASATGTVFENIENNIPRKGIVLFPIYNVHQEPANAFKNAFKVFDLELDSNDNLILNLTWTKFPLRDFYLAHVPFSDAFQRKHGIPFDHIIAVVGALLYRVVSIWKNNNARMINYWQRGYEVISSKEFIITEIKKHLNFSISTLGLQIKSGEINIPEVLSFFELTEDKRENIDIVTQGPHFVFLPSEQHERFVDYVWTWKLLYNLFFGIEVSEQNFKGVALEKAIQIKDMPLPSCQLEAEDGSSRQVDGSYEIGNTLIIFECKAKSMSLASYRGDIRANEERNKHVNNILNDVDDKAQWLSQHPKGSNYDVTRFDKIVPIGISPFNEFMPSLDKKYWLKYPFPRVLFLSELKKLISDGHLEDLAKTTSNIYSIEK
jgi:hypothetical protein